eukprot:236583_1
MSDVCSTLNSFSSALFPSSFEDAYLLKLILTLCSIIIVLCSVIKILQQKRQLKLGTIDEINFWLLPIYYKFLWYLIIIFVVQIIDIVFTYSLFEHNIPNYYAVVHATLFWSSSFWIINFILFFLISKSHGYHAIKTSFYISVIILIINVTLFTTEITLNSGNDDVTNDKASYFSTTVYIIQCTISVIILCKMCYKSSYPHYHIILWVFVLLFLMNCFLRFVDNTLISNNNENNAFCLIVFADYIQNILLPIIIILTLKKDSNLWVNIRHRVLSANRDSIVKVLKFSISTEPTDYMSLNDQYQKQRSVSTHKMEQWSELLSQHTIILNPRKVIPVKESNDNKQTKIKGGSANIIKAKYDDEFIAIKEYRFGKFNRKIIALWCKEVLISSSLKHENIVQLKGILIEPPTIKIVMKWCKYGCLHNMLLDKSQKLSWYIRYSFLIDIANGVNHMHQCGYIYRDLKSLNLLVDEKNGINNPYIIKLCDFGSTALFDKNSRKGTEDIEIKQQNEATEMSTVVGSVAYLPPEILQNIEYDDKLLLSVKSNKSFYDKSVDVFSYGYVIWEIITRRLLYKGKTQRDIKKIVVQQNFRPELTPNDLIGCPDAELLNKLMNDCFNRNPSKRPSFESIMKLLQKNEDKFANNV